MADNTQSEYNHFQFDPFKLGSDWAGQDVQSRSPAAKVSNFGALSKDNRMSDDYTRTVLTFKSKTELENPTVPPFAQDAERDENPYLAGSSIKHVRDDKLILMGLGSIDRPTFDVSDTNAVLSGMEAYKNYPTEGWRSFGGKYDFPVAYNGTL